MLTEFTTWLLGLLQEVFRGLWDFFSDAVINIVDLFLAGFAALFALIPVPSWLSGGLGQLWAQMDPGIIYLANAAGMTTGLAIIGAGYVFRLARKVLTLFQW